jgi:hypothetical protein
MVARAMQTSLEVPPDVRRKFKRQLTVDGVRVTVELLPSLWIHAPFYGIMVTGPGRETASFSIDKPYARATKADFDRLVKKIRTHPCRADRCRARTLNGKDAQVNPPGFCPRHLKKYWASEYEREQEELRAREARADARARARGMRFKTWIWIHRDGNDAVIKRYFAKRPTKSELAKIARANRTKMMGDWSVERI